jgi:hypothetical protein
MKTVKYRKRCFVQIEGVLVENKALTSKVDRLRSEVERTSNDRATQEEQVADLSRHLAEKNKEKIGKTLSRQNVLYLV